MCFVESYNKGEESRCLCEELFHISCMLVFQSASDHMEELFGCTHQQLFKEGIQHNWGKEEGTGVYLFGAFSLL